MRARPPRPVNLICGLISSDPDLMDRAVKLLSDHAGPVDAASETFDFTWTDYYTAEMGEGLLRRFVSFERLIRPDELPAIKNLTNDLEAKICYDLAFPESQRQVNLDPGYLTLAKLVLATCKDYSHRIYLRDGIFAESTLHYEGGKWVAWPWTYPDFAGGQYHTFLSEVRELYRRKLNGVCDATRSRRERSA